MAKQWVDITTIDNTTPFMKVRWREQMQYWGSSDKWFAEAPGLTTDGMSWTQGNTAAWGFYGGHRFQKNVGYTCGFNCEEWGIDTGLDPDVYKTHVKDASRTAYYDSTMIINNIRYYEIDFSQWDYTTGKSLYMPYATNPFAVGDILVEIGEDVISIDKENMSFDSTGGTNTLTVTAVDDWTAVASEPWITASALSGTSGTTTVTISTPDYQGDSARTGTLVFTCSGETATLTVKQRKPSTGVSNLYLGSSAITDVYLGTTSILSCYLGNTPIF